MKYNTSFFLIFILLLSMACNEDRHEIDSSVFTLNLLGLEN
jgi:hypothetical protein